MFAIEEYHNGMSFKGNSSIPSNNAQIHSSGANNWLSKCVTERKKRIHTESSGQQLFNIGGARVIRSGNESTILISGLTPWVEFVVFFLPCSEGSFLVLVGVYSSPHQEKPQVTFSKSNSTRDSTWSLEPFCRCVTTQTFRHLPISFIYFSIYLSIYQYESSNKPNTSFIPCCYAYTDQVVRIEDVWWHREFNRKLWKNYNKIKLKIRMCKNGKPGKMTTWRKTHN